MIDIPESSKDEMFEQTKKEFLQENGVAKAIRQSGQMYIPICTGRCQKMTGCQRDIRWSSTSGHIGTHFILRQRKLILRGRSGSLSRPGRWTGSQGKPLRASLRKAAIPL